MWLFIEKNDIDLAVKLSNIKKENRISMKELSIREGLSYDKVKSLLSLLKLDNYIQDGIGLGVISHGHGKELLRIKNQQIRHTLYIKIISDKLTVRELKKLVNKLLYKNGSY